MALLPPFMLDTVVALGVGDDQSKRQWIGTGFIVGVLVDPSSSGANRRYRTWLITNKHVFQNIKNIYIKLNSAIAEDSIDYKVQLISRNGRNYWVGHPDANIDVAAFYINPKYLRSEDRKFTYFRSDEAMMTRNRMRDGQITEGDRVFVLGFPMGIVNQKRAYPICRGGYLARIRDYIDGTTTDFLIDAPVFPGNSGGPVIICPSALAITGTKTIDKSDLIGIIKSYVPYQDAAISQQTLRPRILFEENSGLALVESVDSILETIVLAEDRIANRNKQKNRRKNANK